MDFILLRSAFTVVSFVVFVGILWWAWQGRQAQGFAEAARIPFEEDQDLSAGLPVRGPAAQADGKESRS